ncbi:hypothetical protein LJB42_001180 [Komagataella kurtzmanii]|nr:hypothetical protein LJB42_001180 [Komagataella kurtzmanii]
MAWWPFSNKKNSQEKQQKEPEPEPRYLDELPPKFDDSKQAVPIPSTSPLKQAVNKISIEDFSPANLISIPCFRDAGLSGFTVMAVFGSITFLYHKNIQKTTNWAFGGFLLGSIFGWEQCNSIRRKSMMTAQIAKESLEQRKQQELRNKVK